MSRITIMILLLTVLLTGACVSRSAKKWVTNDQPMRPAPVELAMPPDLLTDNILTTDYTAVVEIKRARVESLEPGCRGSSYGYERHTYEARVIETLLGAETAEITFSVVAERGLKPNLSDHPIVVSLCHSEGRFFYVPDNGYVSAAPESLVAHARKFVNEGVLTGFRESVCQR